MKAFFRRMMNNARRRKSLYIYRRSAKKNFSFYFYIDSVYIYIHTSRKMYFFPVLLWLLSDILFENTNITRASVPSDHLSLRKVNAIHIYIYTHIWKSVFAFILTIYIFIPICIPSYSRKIIFFSLENTNISFNARFVID